MRNVEGAKAGSNQKKPYRAPVSVTSTQRMRIKYGISEGTIRGFSAEFSHNEMLKRIYLDGTPIMSAEGEQLLDVVVEFRDGSRDQEPINGLPSISVEHDVGVEVKIAAPVSRSFDRSDTTSYDIRISVPTLYRGDDEGNSEKGLIQFKIDVSTDGGAFEEAGRFEIYEKILNGFAETYNVVVPKGSNHVVRISRLNSEIVSDYSVNRLVVEAITENTDVRLRYTNTAVLYLEYDAEQFSNVPKLEMRVFGKNDILVPANYNGDTHTYATSGAGTTNGVWDGTWKRAYTDNPVWISLDLMISRRYGLGDKIDLTFINKWELYGLAQYCDAPVADGKGGFEPRFTCNNMYLQKSEDAYRVLKDLAASFRAKVVWDGEFITLQADIPRDPVHTFSNANASDITYSSTQDSAQRNLINVQYYDRDNKFASDVVMQRSNSNILSRGKVVDGNFTALGCASQGQAQRIASYVMNTELYETELVSFTTGLEGGLVRLNDVIQMADNSVAGQTVGGRIAAVNGRSITLDRKIPDNVQAIATTQLSINQQDVKNEPISIVSISDDRMTAVLASDAPAGTEAGLVWALLTQDLVPQKFVVTDIEFDSTNMTFAVSAIQYNESKYAAIDGSARIVVPPISVTEYKMLKAPIIVIASYLTRIIQDAVVCDIDVSWAQSTNAVQYQLEMQKAGSDWRIVGRFMSLATTLDNMYTGTYTFRVCAYDSLGNASQYTYSDPILVAGKVLPPPMLTQYDVIGILFGYQHKWIYPAHTEDSRAVRLRFTTTDPVASPAQEWQYVDVAYPTTNFTEQDVTAHLRTWFSAAIVDKYGNVGAYTAWLSVVPSSNPAQVLDLLDGQLTAQQLDQDLTNKIAIGAEAALAAESAQNAADAAAQAAINAQAAADQVQAQVTTTTTELRGLLDVTADGLTQEILDRQEGDADVVGQLTTYKTSNDAAMAAVQQQAEAASSASSANATTLTNLNTEVVAANNLASNALQQAQSATDATSTNASNLIALSSRMDSAVQAGDNLLVNSNVDKPYNGNYPHGIYALGESWEVGATYTLLWCASFLRTNWDQVDLVLAAYAGGGLQGVQSIDTEGERQVHKVTFVVRPEGTGRNDIHFYLLNSNGGYLDAVATVHWAVLVKASDISTKVWVRSKYDVDNAINANSQAIRNTETNVATIDSKVTAQATDILDLNTGLTNLNNTKLDASIIQQYRTAVDQDSVTSDVLTQFKSTLKVGGVNVLLNSKEPRSGVNEYLMYENSVELKDFYDQNLNKDVTISCEIYVPVAGNVQIYTSNQSAHNFSFGAPIPANQWTRVVATVKPVPHDTNPNYGLSSLEFYGEYGTGRIVTVRNVQLEAGNFATDWSPSPRDYANEFDLAAQARANMYTKTEADSATAGHIQEFNSNLKIGGTNIYSRGTVLSNYGISIDTRLNSSQGNLLVLGTHIDGPRTLRFEDIVPEMGWYTVSGYVRGNQGVSARFAIDFCDQGQAEIVTRDDNFDKYFEVSVNVQNTTHRFMDIEPLQWLNYEFRNIKIEKGNKATSWSPAPYDTADATALNQTQATVADMDGRLNSTATQVSNLEAKINSRNGFYLYSGGLEATTGGMGYIRTLNDDSWRYDVGRSYGLIVFRPNTGYVGSASSFDVYGGQVQGFAAAVEAIPNGWYAAVLTSDEPLGNSSVIKPYLKMLGGTDAIDGMVARGAYMLIGQKGMSQGQALEMVSSDKLIGIQYILEFAAGVPVGLGGSSPSAVVNQQTRAEVQEIDGQVTALAVETNTLSTTVGNNTAAIQLQQSSIDGINAKATLQVEAGGVVGGVALGNNGGVVDFVMRVNTFAIAPPVSAGAGDAGKYMFQYRATPVTLPNGHVSPAGAYIGRASIDYIDATQIYVESLSAISAELGTIKVGSANIAKLAVNAAHISDAAITSAKIGDLQVDTLKIKDEAVTVGVAVQGAASLSIETSGGKVNVAFGLGVSFTVSSTSRLAQTLYLRVMRGAVEIKRFSLGSVSGDLYVPFLLMQSLPPIIDNPVAGTHTYTLQYKIVASNQSLTSFDNITEGSAYIKSQHVSVSLSEVKK